MQRERRRDPYPWTWEVPLAVTVATLFVIIIGIQLGRSDGMTDRPFRVVTGRGLAAHIRGLPSRVPCPAYPTCVGGPGVH